MKLVNDKVILPVPLVRSNDINYKLNSRD